MLFRSRIQIGNGVSQAVYGGNVPPGGKGTIGKAGRAFVMNPPFCFSLFGLLLDQGGGVEGLEGK